MKKRLFSWVGGFFQKKVNHERVTVKIEDESSKPIQEELISLESNDVVISHPNMILDVLVNRFRNDSLFWEFNCFDVHSLLPQISVKQISKALNRLRKRERISIIKKGHPNTFVLNIDKINS